MTTNRRLERLRDAGVSIWLDTLSRELLETGEFERLVRDLAITGATSNPTISAGAITGSDRAGADASPAHAGSAWLSWARAPSAPREGVDAFCASYRKLLDCIATKMRLVADRSELGAGRAQPAH